MNFLVLVRPGMIYLTFIFNMVLIGYLIRYKISPTLKISLPMLFTIVMIFMQAFTIYKTYGNFTVSYIDKYGWYLYLGAQSNADATGVSFFTEKDIRSTILYSLPFKEQHGLAKKDMRFQLKSHPKLVLGNYIHNVYDNIVIGNTFIAKAKDLVGVPYYNYVRYYLYLIAKAQNILFSILGLFLSFFIVFRYKMMNLSLFMSSAIICYTILTSGISLGQGDRFHLVFYPLVLIVFSYFLTGYRWFNEDTIE
jgi:hypothetical protein